MRNGFIFKDRHSSDFGVTVRTKSRPILPSVKENIVDLPYRDGGYDFSKANPFGREFYNDRIFTVTFNIYADNLAEMQRKLSLLSLWLCGEGELIFDDMPFSKWRGKVSDEVIYMPEHSGHKAVMEVSFRAEPFCKCIFDTEGPALGMPFMLGANIPIDISCLFKFNISGSGDISVYNFGDRPVRPIVKLGASARNVTLSMNGKSLAFMSNGQTTIDFEKQNVKVKIVTIAEASSIVISEKPSGYLICTSPELLKKAVSVKVMVDQAIKNKTPVFIMGNIDELELLWETLPQQMVMDVFTRPITVGDMVDNICTQMNDFYQLKKRTILAVDDSGIILRKIKALLEDTYQVVLANSGAMAIKYLTLNTPDLILLDYAMPIVDGSQIMQMLREDPEFHHIPIIFLTGKNDAETVKNVMSLKPDGYLLKSMDPQKLHAAIDDFFASRGK